VSPAAASRAPRRGAVKASLLVVVIGLSMQTGSAIAVRVIDGVGVVEALWLRTFIAAVILAAVRPRSLRLPPKGRRLPLAALTASLLVMNLSFYGAISRAPVGIVVAIEFVGPLAVAVMGSRRVVDFVWIALAAAGVVALAGPSGSISGVALALTLTAAAGWAAFILLAKHSVGVMDPLSVTTLMLTTSALVLTPVMIVGGVEVTGDGTALALGAAVAVLSSALPYFLELVALSMVRASTYGVLLSMEPAVAALAGYVVLSQQLDPMEIVAIGLVMAAAAGASWTGGDAGPPLPAEI
jgi:inner membrane transporter RhtA